MNEWWNVNKNANVGKRVEEEVDFLIDESFSLLSFVSCNI